MGATFHCELIGREYTNLYLYSYAKMGNHKPCDKAASA